MTRRKWRRLASTALIAGVLAAGGGARAESAADIFGNFQAGSTDPVEVTAETLEVFEEGSQRLSVFSGNVVVRRGKTLIKAAKIILFSNLDEPSAEGFTRIEASGNVFIGSGDQSVTGRTAVVEMTTNTVTISGEVVLAQGNNVITGSRMVVNMATGRARLEQTQGGRIRGVFSPNSQ